MTTAASSCAPPPCFSTTSCQDFTFRRHRHDATRLPECQVWLPPTPVRHKPNDGGLNRNRQTDKINPRGDGERKNNIHERSRESHRILCNGGAAAPGRRDLPSSASEVIIWGEASQTRRRESSDGITGCPWRVRLNIFRPMRWGIPRLSAEQARDTEVTEPCRRSPRPNNNNTAAIT